MIKFTEISSTTLPTLSQIKLVFINKCYIILICFCQIFSSGFFSKTWKNNTQKKSSAPNDAKILEKKRSGVGKIENSTWL